MSRAAPPVSGAIAEAFAVAGGEVLALGLACDETLPVPIRTAILDITDGEAVDALVNGLTTLDVDMNAAGIIRRVDEFELDIFGRVPTQAALSRCSSTTRQRPYKT